MSILAEAMNFIEVPNLSCWLLVWNLFFPYIGDNHPNWHHQPGWVWVVKLDTVAAPGGLGENPWVTRKFWWPMVAILQGFFSWEIIGRLVDRPWEISGCDSRCALSTFSTHLLHPEGFWPGRWWYAGNGGKCHVSRSDPEGPLRVVPSAGACPCSSDLGSNFDQQSATKKWFWLRDANNDSLKISVLLSIYR